MTKPKIEFTWSVNLGQLLTIVAIVAAGVTFAVRLEGRINVQEVRMNGLEDRFERSEARSLDALRSIQEDVEAIKERLVPRDMPERPR